MKFVIIGPAYPYRGGLAAFSHRLANEIITEGNEVVLYTYTKQYPKILFPGKTQITKGLPPEKLIIKRSINSINPLSWTKTAKLVNGEKADVVIFAYWMSFMAPCMGAIARQLNKETKKIALVHNYKPHEPSLMDRLLTPYFFKSVDGYITLSKDVCGQIEKICGDKPVKYTPHPIYDHYGEKRNREVANKFFNQKDDYVNLLFFGFIRKYKGLDILLDALTDNRFMNKRIQLIIAGEFYENRAPYDKQIQALSNKLKVKLFADYIKDEDLPYFFSAADLVIQPYRTATQSGVAQIAYFYGIPMLVTNVGGLGEIVPHEKVGYCVEPTSQDIADAILDFVNNNRAEEFKKNIITERERFSWGRMTEVIKELSTEIKK